MTVLTISREFGSGGSQIAAEAAEMLAYHFVDKAGIAKILSQYGFIRFGEEYDSLPGFWSRFNSRRAEMVLMLNQVILALAAHGNVVILGRGSFALLAGYADVLNVRTQAPLSVRIGRVTQQQKISQREAKTLVNENDLVRASFVESSYSVRWDSSTLFDLVIDTSKVQTEKAVNWLVETTKGLNSVHAVDMPASTTIEVSPVLANVVSQTLNCYDAHTEATLIFANQPA